MPRWACRTTGFLGRAWQRIGLYWRAWQMLRQWKRLARRPVEDEKAVPPPSEK
jgi:hypothetical protein